MGSAHFADSMIMPIRLDQTFATTAERRWAEGMRALRKRSPSGGCKPLVNRM